MEMARGERRVVRRSRRDVVRDNDSGDVEEADKERPMFGPSPSSPLAAAAAHCQPSPHTALLMVLFPSSALRRAFELGFNMVSRQLGPPLG